MKKNSKKVLLSIFSDNKEVLRLNIRVIELLLPDLSKDGRRSLLHLLEKKELIQIIRLQDNTYVSLSDKGRTSLKAEFPALYDSLALTNEVWKVIVFKTPPKGDPQFRFLRAKILSSGGHSLSRGVFIFTSIIPVPTMHVLQTLYAENIYMFSVGEWYLGTQSPIIQEQFHTSDLISAYSSISKQTTSLLTKFETKKGLNDSLKNDFIKIYQRWFDTFSEDRGLVTRYFPQETSGMSVLKEIQKLLQHV